MGLDREDYFMLDKRLEQLRHTYPDMGKIETKLTAINVTLERIATALEKVLKTETPK